MILDGDLQFEIMLDGDYCEETLLDGDFLEVMNISDVPVYGGSYEATPSDVEQVIEVSGLQMADDFIIKPIPQNYGLITWDGSTITVS